MNLKNLAAYAIGPIGTAVLSFLTLPILAWIFSPEDIGRITLLQVVVSFSFIIIGLSLEQAYVREFYEHQNKPALLRTVVLPGFFLLLAFTAISLLLKVDIANILFAKHDSNLTILAYVCIWINFFTMHSSLVLRMQERAFAYSLISLLTKLVFFVFISIVFLGDVEKSFGMLIGLHTLSMMVAFLVAIWLSKNDWRAAYKAPFLTKEFSGFVRFSAPLIFGSFAYWGLTTIDRLAIRTWSTFEQLGIFSIAVSFAGVAVLFQTIFTTMWMPFVYRWNAEGVDREELNKVVEYVLAAVVFIYSLVGCFSWIFSYLLPEKYSIVPYIIPACMGAPLLYMLSETTVVGIHLTRKTFFAMLAPVIAFVSNIALNYLLVPGYGAAGAAAATSIAFFVFLLLRTEFSAFLWHPFPRKKIYFFAFLCSTVSSLQAIFYTEFANYIFLVWCVIFFVALIAFKSTILDFIKFASHHYKIYKSNTNVEKHN